MNGLGAERIPDPTTAGDFLRRFDADSINALQAATNEIRKKVWRLQGYGLVSPSPITRKDIVRMEFKRFLNSFIQLPCQIVSTGRRLVYRILTYSKHLKPFFETFEYIKRLKFA
jgi:hypothetical protein